MSATAFKANIIANILQTQHVSIQSAVTNVSLAQFQALTGDDRGITYRALAPHQRLALANELAARMQWPIEEAKRYLKQKFGGER